MRRLASISLAAAAALSLAACQSTGGIGNLLTPTVAADNLAVFNANLIVIGDWSKANADRTSNPTALPADVAQLAADQIPLVKAWSQLVADLKAAGLAVPAPPPGLGVAAPAPKPAGA
jgi:hypothetical protein